MQAFVGERTIIKRRAYSMHAFGGERLSVVSDERTGFMHLLVYERSFLTKIIHTGSMSDIRTGHEQ